MQMEEIKMQTKTNRSNEKTYLMALFTVVEKKVVGNMQIVMVRQITLTNTHSAHTHTHTFS